MEPERSPLGQARQGSTTNDGFTELARSHQETLLRVALQLTGSRGEAEDLVQETLFKAFRAFDRLRPDSQPRPWLLRILRNTHISHWRRKRREREALSRGTEEALVQWLQPEGSSASLGVEGRPDADLGDEVVKALGEVPPNYLTCLLLVDVHQKSYLEAAQLTNQPLGTVQSRLHRGRRILKGLLRDYARREGYLAQAA